MIRHRIKRLEAVTGGMLSSRCPCRGWPVLIQFHGQTVNRPAHLAADGHCLECGRPPWRVIDIVTPLLMAKAG